MDTAERLAKQNNWTCYLCRENHNVNQHADPNCPIDESAKNMKVFTKSSLRILQWNAEGLKSKSDELAHRLKESDIDVAVIQETWLNKKDSTPAVGEYVAVREDRKTNIKRGGLLFYIRRTINHSVEGYKTKNGQEIHSIRVRLSRKNWITITNFYIPPPSPLARSLSMTPR